MANLHPWLYDALLIPAPGSKANCGHQPQRATCLDCGESKSTVRKDIHKCFAIKEIFSEPSVPRLQERGNPLIEPESHACLPAPQRILKGLL